MTSTEEKLQCYNRSCGQLFDPAENEPDSCIHHPGFPVFHDAYKKWSCCEKKTTDFTEFLNIKGCTRSYHSNVKPVEPEKPVTQNQVAEVQSIPEPLSKQKEPVVRPDSSEPLQLLSSVIGPSLKPILEKMGKHNPEKEKDQDTVVQLNAPCQNRGCHATYKGEQSNVETCLYHSGVPVFHEGLKYWSCCVKRTTDFDSFLEQIGCTTGNHRWHKNEENNFGTKAKCRYDWHQTGNFLVISVYSKSPLPDLSFVKANQVKLHMHIVFGEKREIFDEELLLFGVIDVSGSLVTYLGTKVEVKLKKAAPIQLWKQLKHVECDAALPSVESMHLQDTGDK